MLKDSVSFRFVISILSLHLIALLLLLAFEHPFLPPNPPLPELHFPILTRWQQSIYARCPRW